MKQNDNDTRARDALIRMVILDNNMGFINFLTLNFINNEKDIIIAGTDTTGEKAVELVKAISPDIVLLGTNIKGSNFNCIDIAQAISKIGKTKIIMMSETFSEDLIKYSFAAGAVNFLLKSDTQNLPEIIRTTYNGYSVIETLARDYGKLKATERKDKMLNVLSGAEKEVIDLYIMGYKRKDIADRLGKTEDTIKNQVSSSYKKLNIGRRKDLIEIIQK